MPTVWQASTWTQYLKSKMATRGHKENKTKGEPQKPPARLGLLNICAFPQSVEASCGMITNVVLANSLLRKPPINGKCANTCMNDTHVNAQGCKPNAKADMCSTHTIPNKVCKATHDTQMESRFVFTGRLCLMRLNDRPKF